ncbi:MAG: hypothetical protein M3248_03170 [Actinomycetota bacterium]|nr:hypothetical protein [Actinomycetota bacterium]
MDAVRVPRTTLRYFLYSDPRYVLVPCSAAGEAWQILKDTMGTGLWA